MDHRVCGDDLTTTSRAISLYSWFTDPIPKFLIFKLNFYSARQNPNTVHIVIHQLMTATAELL